MEGFPGESEILFSSSKQRFRLQYRHLLVRQCLDLRPHKCLFIFSDRRDIEFTTLKGVCSLEEPVAIFRMDLLSLNLLDPHLETNFVRPK